MPKNWQDWSYGRKKRWIHRIRWARRKIFIALHTMIWPIFLPSATQTKWQTWSMNMIWFVNQSWIFSQLAISFPLPYLKLIAIAQRKLPHALNSNPMSFCTTILTSSSKLSPISSTKPNKTCENTASTSKISKGLSLFWEAGSKALELATARKDPCRGKNIYNSKWWWKNNTKIVSLESLISSFEQIRRRIVKISHN